MKRLLFVSVMIALAIGACVPTSTQPQQDNPTPIIEADLQLTAAVLSQQTLQALPTSTALPSETPVINTPSPTITASPETTTTETPNPVLETLTATLLAGTSETTPFVSGTVGTPPETSTPGATITATIGTPQPLTHGTLPPNLPSGRIVLFNKSHVEVYVSLRCVTKEGYVTYLEYPVKKNFSISAPAGQYTYTAWVGGRQSSGGFSLSQDTSKTITFYQDKIHITK